MAHRKKVGASLHIRKKDGFGFVVFYWQRKLFVKGVGGLTNSAVMDCELPEPELLSWLSLVVIPPLLSEEEEDVEESSSSKQPFRKPSKP